MPTYKAVFDLTNGPYYIIRADNEDDAYSTAVENLVDDILSIDCEITEVEEDELL